MHCRWSGISRAAALSRACGDEAADERPKMRGTKDSRASIERSRACERMSASSAAPEGPPGPAGRRLRSAQPGADRSSETSDAEVGRE